MGACFFASHVWLSEGFCGVGAWCCATCRMWLAFKKLRGQSSCMCIVSIKGAVLFYSLRLASALCTCPCLRAAACGGAFTQHSMLKRKQQAKQQVKPTGRGWAKHITGISLKGTQIYYQQWYFSELSIKYTYIYIHIPLSFLLWSMITDDNDILYVQPHESNVLVSLVPSCLVALHRNCPWSEGPSLSLLDVSLATSMHLYLDTIWISYVYIIFLPHVYSYTYMYTHTCTYIYIY